MAQVLLQGSWYDTNANNTFIIRQIPRTNYHGSEGIKFHSSQKKGAIWSIIPELGMGVFKKQMTQSPPEAKKLGCFWWDDFGVLGCGSNFLNDPCLRNLMDFHPSLKWQVVSMGWCEPQVFTNRKWVGNHDFPPSIHPSIQSNLVALCKKLYPHLPTNSYLSGATSQDSNLMDEKRQSPNLHPFNLCWL